MFRKDDDDRMLRGIVETRILFGPSTNAEDADRVENRAEKE